MAASPAGSLAVLLVVAVRAGSGHRIAFLSAQEELNDLAPAERRGEVSAASIACISASVEAVAGFLAACALAGIAWQLRRR